MKKTLPVLLMLLFACPVWGATALEIYHGSTSTKTVITTDAWTAQTGSAITVDRTGEAGTKAFIVIANMSASTDATTAEGAFRLLQNISGTHDGGDNNATVLTDSGAAFPTTNGGLVGYTLYNTTDDALCIVTSNIATAITCAHGIEGGTDNDWDDDDVYALALGSPGTSSATAGGTPTLGFVDEGLASASAPASNGAGMPAMVIIRRVSLSNTSHTFTWQGTNPTATSNLNLEQSSIVVLEMSANMEYTELYSAENFDSDVKVSDSGIVDALALSFTATAELWVILFNIEMSTEDENDAGCDGPWFNRETTHPTVDIEYGDIGSCSLLGDFNDHATHAPAAVGIETLTAATHRFSIEWDGGGSTGDETKLTRASIVAFPVSDFENHYFDCNGTSGDCATVTEDKYGSTYSDTPVDLDGQAITANKTHLVIAHAEVSNENTADRGSVKLHVDDDESILVNPDARNGTDWLAFGVDAKDTTGTSATFKLLAISSNADSTREARTRDIYMIVLEIPEAGGAARRSMSISLN